MLRRLTTLFMHPAAHLAAWLLPLLPSLFPPLWKEPIRSPDPPPTFLRVAVFASLPFFFFSSIRELDDFNIKVLQEPERFVISE